MNTKVFLKLFLKYLNAIIAIWQAVLCMMKNNILFYCTVHVLARNIREIILV